jgi:hypothetical protein
MNKRLRVVVGAVLAFVLLSAGECEFSSLGDILDKPGRIVVSNVGTETAVVAIIANDVKSYPTLAGGATASVETNVGGAYQVRVVMTPENTQRYREDLVSLKQIVQQFVDGAASTDEKTRLFAKLAGINAAIAALEQTNAAGCSGNIEINQDNPEIVNATVTWVRQSGAGFWDTTCGST